MHTKLSLSLTDARAITQAAEAYAQSRDLSVSIAVVDQSTYLQYLVRMDGAPFMSAEGATDKARSAAEGGHPTSFFENALNEGMYSVLRLPVTPIEGGLPVLVDGQCAGAIGVSGVLPQDDAAIAAAGLQALARSRASG